MSSVTATLFNSTSFPVTLSAGGASHGLSPQIITQTIQAGQSATAFTANSDGAGVEGDVIVAGNGVQWTLHYDNPVVGSNSGNVNSPEGYSGSVNVGGGTNANFGYAIGVAS